MGMPLKRPYGSALDYSACLADGARLVAVMAVDAAARGAVIQTGARVARAERGEDWRLAVIVRGERRILTARALVNATGAWAADTAEILLRQQMSSFRLIKYGSVLVPRLYDHDNAYRLDDGAGGEIVVLPFDVMFNQVGHTRAVFSGDVAMPALTGQEIASLCATVSRYFRQSIEPDGVVSTFAAVGAFGKGAGPQVHLNKRFREAPLVTVYGGSVTLARRTAEVAMAKLSRFFVAGPNWTAAEPLPGGDFPSPGLDDLVADVRFRWPSLSLSQALRLARAYGTRVEAVLGGAQQPSDLGEMFGELSAAEVRYLMTTEWARTVDDVLSRRSASGLTMAAADRARLAEFMAQS